MATMSMADLLASAERTLAANAEHAARLAELLGQQAADTDSAHVRAQGAQHDNGPERWAYVAHHAAEVARLARLLQRSALACGEMAEQVRIRAARLDAGE